MPMPEFENYKGMDVVVVRVPCKGVDDGEGNNKDLSRLQLNLVVANLLVRSVDQLDRTAHVVFLGSCGPMRELFRCEDLVFRDGDGVWVYRPNLRKLKQKVQMPVGTCQVANPHEKPGEETWRTGEVPAAIAATEISLFRPREAYVTVLHSSDTYVCGAIALAQSIIRTNTTKDLVLLADNSITETSLEGLRQAGWKIKHMEDIPNPNSETKVLSEWTYKKLQIWLLTEYDKIMYLDAYLLVLHNLDEFFAYPQLSAVADFVYTFNSGVMLIEPSKCAFEILLEKLSNSDDGADQGFLNEMFPWWHRLPVKLNRRKLFDMDEDSLWHEMPKNSYVIHYLGLKPWMCPHDYDCNWDIPDFHRFASDSAHRRWLELFRSTSKMLQQYCEITLQEDPALANIRMWREGQKADDDGDDGNLLHKHWRIFLVISLFLLSLLFVLLRGKMWSSIVFNWMHEKTD